MRTVPDTRIKLTIPELQSGTDRVKWEEGLIIQLPEDHDSRNSWLLNYGTNDFSKALRAKRGLNFNEEFQACETTGA